MHGWNADTALEGLHNLSLLQNGIHIAVPSLGVFGLYDHVFIGLDVASQVQRLNLASIKDGVEAVSPAYPNFYGAHYYYAISPAQVRTTRYPDLGIP